MRPFIPALGLALPLALYFALALPQIDLPGVHNDEAAEAGLQAMQILSGQPIAAFRDVGLSIGDRTFPLMVQDYIGAFNVYFVLPFFAAFGSTVSALRLYTVLIGAVTMLCTHGFMAEAFGKRPAFIASLLLAASPSFIFWQRQGVFVASLTSTLTMATLWVGAVWAKRGSPTTAWKWAALLGLLCGAGLYAKLLFVWVIGGMIGALIVINTPSLARLALSAVQNPKPQIPNPNPTYNNQQSHSASLRGLSSAISHQQFFPHTPTLPHLFPRTPALADLLAFALGLFIGLSPLIAYNLQTGGTLASVGANLTTSYYGVNNLDFAENLRGRIDQFNAVLEGRDHLWYLGGSFGNGGWQTAMRLSALVVLARAVFRRQRSRLPLALLLLLAFGVIQSSFTVSGLFPTHFAIFAALPAVIVAAACETIFDVFFEPMLTRFATPIGKFFSGGRYLGGIGFITDAMLVLAFALGWLFARDVMVTIDYHLALNKSGGLGPHSDAIYRLVDYLADLTPPRPSPSLKGRGGWRGSRSDAAPGGVRSVIAMDWGFAPQVRMLTNGQIEPQEIFGYSWEADSDFEARLAAALDQPGALFVFHFPQETIFPRRQIFDAMMIERGLQVEQLAIISRRDGAPIFEVVRVQR